MIWLQLDLMIFKVFSNLSSSVIDSIPWEMEPDPWGNKDKTKLEKLIILQAAYLHGSCWLVFNKTQI